MYTFQLTTNLTQDRGSDLGLSSGTTRAAECGTGTLTGEAEAGVMGHSPVSGWAHGHEQPSQSEHTGESSGQRWGAGIRRACQTGNV